MRVFAEWLLTAERLALHLPSGTGVVADLHLGYDRARRLAGEAVPLVPLDEQLGPLLGGLARHGVRRLVVAGDLVEDPRCGGLVDEFRDQVDRVGVELVAVLAGNHDRPGAPSGDALRLGDWVVVHGDGNLPEGRVVHGHDHPWLRWRGHAGAPCFLAGEGELVLPAYSADAAGANVLGVRRWRAHRCLVIAGPQVLDFGPVGGLGRRLRQAGA